MPEAADWVKRALEALARTEIMVLATVDAESGTWASPVQFHTNSLTELSFLSLPGTRHGRNEVWCFDSRVDHERHRIDPKQ